MRANILLLATSASVGAAAVVVAKTGVGCVALMAVGVVATAAVVASVVAAVAVGAVLGVVSTAAVPLGAADVAMGAADVLLLQWELLMFQCRGTAAGGGGCGGLHGAGGDGGRLRPACAGGTVGANVGEDLLQGLRCGIMVSKSSVCEIAAPHFNDRPYGRATCLYNS